MGELIIELIGKLIAQRILLPVLLILATPFVLISAPFRRGGVKSGYAAVYQWWDNWGFSLT
jgi:hypothetical protein